MVKFCIETVLTGDNDDYDETIDHHQVHEHSHSRLCPFLFGVQGEEDAQTGQQEDFVDDLHQVL